MFSSIMLFVGILLLLLSIKVFIKEMDLYKNGVVKNC